MAHQLFQLPKQTNISSFKLEAGAKASFYATTTSTPQDTFTTSALSVAHTNPVIADAAGVFPAIYLDPSLQYKLTLTTAADVLIYTIDPVNDLLLSQSIFNDYLGLSDPYKRTGSEIAEGVTPTNYAYPYGHAHRYGATGDGVTNDAAAIQILFNLLLSRGGTGIFDGTKTYKCNSGLTLVSTANPAKGFTVEFNNCTLDFTDLTGSAKAITYGADSLAHAHDQEQVEIGPVNIIGPETIGAGVPTYAGRITTTTGVSLEYCLHWVFRAHKIQAFFKGMRTYWSWANLHYGHDIRTCYQNLHIDQISTLSTWLECSFIEGSVGTLFRGEDTISGQRFFGCRWEGNDVMWHMDGDPGALGGTITIRGITFVGCYMEDATYDYCRVGMDYDDTALASVRGTTNASGLIENITISGQNWANNALDPASGTAAFCFDSAASLNARVRGFVFQGPISLRQRCQGRPAKSSWKSTFNVFHTTDDAESFDIGEASANITMTNSSCTLGRANGNISGITHVSDGIFDVTLREAYTAAAEYTVTGSADNRVVTVSNTSASVCRVTVRDFAGTAAFAATCNLRVEGRMA